MICSYIFEFITVMAYADLRSSTPTLYRRGQVRVERKVEGPSYDVVVGKGWV